MTKEAIESKANNERVLQSGDIIVTPEQFQQLGNLVGAIPGAYSKNALVLLDILAGQKCVIAPQDEELTEGNSVNGNIEPIEKEEDDG